MLCVVMVIHYPLIIWVVLFDGAKFRMNCRDDDRFRRSDRFFDSADRRCVLISLFDCLFDFIGL